MEGFHPQENIGPAAIQFLHDLAQLLQQTLVTDRAGSELCLQVGLERAVATMRATSDAGGKVFFVGNGGSAAIASHVSTDMWKNGKMEAVAFNDPSLLTCLSNDCGYEEVFAVALRRFARPADTLVAISSSGCSPNILAAVTAARELGCHIIGLSGFNPDNPLRTAGDLNFHLASHVYGIVEAGHLALLHSMLDAHMGYPAAKSINYHQHATPGGLEAWSRATPGREAGA